MYLIKVIDGWSCRLLPWISQDLPEGQLQRGICSIELLMQDKGILVIAGRSVYLPKWKRVHVASIFQGLIKVCRKLNRNIAMDNFIKYYQPGINPPVFKWPPSKLTQHVSDTFIWRELVFDPSSCLSLGHFNFIYVMLCVGDQTGEAYSTWGRTNVL